MDSERPEQMVNCSKGSASMALNQLFIKRAVEKMLEAKDCNALDMVLIYISLDELIIRCGKLTQHRAQKSMLVWIREQMKQFEWLKRAVFDKHLETGTDRLNFTYSITLGITLRGLKARR